MVGYRTLFFLVLLLVLPLGACQSGGVNPLSSSPVEVESSLADSDIQSAPPGIELEPPSTLCGRVTTLYEGWLRLGANYVPELLHQNIEVENTSLRYLPGSSGPASGGSSAVAFYNFSMINHPLRTELKLIWAEAPSPSLCWIGLARDEEDDWDWLTADSSWTWTLNPLTDYVRDDELLTVAVVVQGDVPALLDYVRLGYNQAPVAALEATPETGDYPLPVRLDASGSYDPDGRVVRYDWDFDGDGKVDSRSYTQAFTDFTYSKPGDYNPTVTVYDDNGDSDSASLPVTVINSFNMLPEAELTCTPAYGSAPCFVSYDAGESRDSDGEIVRYDWDFDGDGAVDERTTEPTANHTFTTDGIFTSAVYVTDNRGGSDSAKCVIQVQSWVHTWGDERTEELVDVCEGQGAVYACGTCIQGYDLDDTDALLVKFTQDGEFEWSRVWDNGYYDGLRSVAVDSRGCVWACGSTKVIDQVHMYEQLLLQFSPDGELLLEKTLHFEDSRSVAWIVLVDSEDNKYVLGSAYEIFLDSGRISFAKYDPEGRLDWTRSWGGSEAHNPTASSAILRDDSMIIGGRVGLEDFGFVQTLLMEITLDSDVKRARAYHFGEEAAGIGGFALAPDGGCYLSGYCVDRYCESCFLVCRLDAAWDAVWARTYGLNSQAPFLSYCGIGSDGLLDTYFYLDITDGEGGRDRTETILSFTDDGEMTDAVRRDTPYWRAMIGHPGQLMYIVGGGETSQVDPWAPLEIGVDFSIESREATVTEINLPMDDIEGLEWNPEGTVTAPAGVVDTGGGYRDAFIATYY